MNDQLRLVRASTSNAEIGVREVEIYRDMANNIFSEVDTLNLQQNELDLERRELDLEITNMRARLTVAKREKKQLKRIIKKKRKILADLDDIISLCQQAR